MSENMTVVWLVAMPMCIVFLLMVSTLMRIDL